MSLVQFAVSNTKEVLLDFIDNTENILDASNFNNVDIVSLVSNNSVICQTPQALSAHSPRKTKLRQLLYKKISILSA